MEPVRIRVATERPYEVVVGRELTGELVAQVAGAPKVAIDPSADPGGRRRDGCATGCGRRTWTRT